MAEGIKLASYQSETLQARLATIGRIGGATLRERLHLHGIPMRVLRALAYRKPE